jgi:hypothetical protein
MSWAPSSRNTATSIERVPEQRHAASREDAQMGQVGPLLHAWGEPAMRNARRIAPPVSSLF